MVTLGAAALGAGLAATGSLIGSGINAYFQHRENNTMREREDTAISRRIRDLEASGLSPVLAAGSAASASRGDAPSVSGSALGAWLDARNGFEQLKQNEYMTTIAKEQAYQAELASEEMNRQNVDSDLSFMWSHGLPVTGVGYGRDNRYFPMWNVSVLPNYADRQEGYFNFSTPDSPFFQSLRNGLTMQNYARDMAEKENAWYNFNQGLNAVSTGVGLGLNAFNTFGSFGLKKASQVQQFNMFQQELNRKQNYDSWRMSPHSTTYRNNRGFSSYYQYR